VDRTSGDVFVGDPGAGMVDVYSATGAFLTQFGEGKLGPVGVAVDEANGQVYVADSFTNAVLVFRANGAGGYEQFAEWVGARVPGEAFGEVAGVAVDNSTGPSAGDVYVLDAEAPEAEGGAVDVFKPQPAGAEEALEGELVRRLTSEKMEAPNGVAVSASSGEVYVADSVKGAVYEFSSSGVLVGKPLTGSGSPQGKFGGMEAGEEEGNVTAVALDETTGDLLVAESQRHVVSEFNSAGEWVGWIVGTPTGGFGEPRGVAVGAGGQVYVADTLARRVDAFGPGVVVPDVVTRPASKLMRTTALLNGTIDGDGKAARYHFDWGTSEALGSSTPVSAGGSGEEKVSASLSGLHAGTTYFFRLVAENEDGANVGVIRQFTTAPAVEALSTGAAQNITPAGATLTGSLTPNGVDAHYYFEWGLTEQYGSDSPAFPPGVDAGSGSEAVMAETLLEGLSQNTTYHYRLVGENEQYGTTFGEDRTFTTAGVPRITTEPASGIGHETATIKARVDPDELTTSYHFEYGETTSYGREAPAGGAGVGSGSEPVAESQTLSALRLGGTYHYRVVASNGAGTTFGPDQTFTSIPPAAIDSESVGEVGSSTAKLQGEIDPLGHDTTAYFQYGVESCEPNPGACTDVPAAPGTELGSGETGVPISEAVGGLRSGTSYHYRVLALNALGVSEGPEHIFTTKAASAPFVLPDDRAWEMVSPPEKGGAPVEALTREGGLIRASETGDALTYVAGSALGEQVEGNRTPEWQQVLATRTPTGWVSQDIATPSSRALGVEIGTPPEYEYFTPEKLETALVQPAELDGTAEPPLVPGVTQATMYLRDDTNGTYVPVVSSANVFAGTRFGGEIQFVDGTPDLSHVVFSSRVALLGPASVPGLYEWAGGSLQLVSVLPDGEPAKGLVELGYSHVQAGSISNDGSRVIWTKVESEPHLGHLYMRDSLTGETVQLDAAQGVSEPTGAGTARFQAASSEGSRVFFTDRQKLTPDSTAEPSANEPDLYECQMVVKEGRLACELTDLTAERNAGEHANVQGLLLGTSEEGASTYFVAQGVLAANENGNAEAAVAGGDNLYEAHWSGAGWATTFIATLSGEDKPEWEGDGVANTAYLTARVSPDGRYLAFMSAASLTGYDNTDQGSGQPDEEVYLYDAATASLRCVSCDPTGARPEAVLDAENVGEGLGLLVDRRKVWLGHWLAGSIPGWTAESLVNALIQSRYLDDDGRLYFTSPDDLVPAATNHKEDVYQYEPSGVGSCQSATGGCVSLISSGNSPKESAFIEATPDGSNVFFVTEAQLLPQDTDTAFDIYDARVCTEESPCLSPPAPLGSSCENASECHPAPAAQLPALQASGSATVTPQSNNAPAAQAKAQTKAVKTRAKPLTRAQELANALKVCKQRYARSKQRRQACEKHARKLHSAKRTIRSTRASRPRAGARARGAR
jgi:DNA-binding beta-propeller fold protein YncE